MFDARECHGLPARGGTPRHYSSTFHGGFGLINYAHINKPAFYAYQFLNRLGPTELKGSDPASWICTDKSGGIQALVWDLTITHPGTNVINQVYYKRDLPSLPKNKVTLNLTNVPKGKYALEIYKVGYRVNDAYATYLDRVHRRN